MHPFLPKACAVAAVGCLLACGDGAARVFAAVPEPARPPAYGTFYAGRLIANDLPPLLFDVARGRLEWRDSGFVGGSYARTVPLPGWLADLADFAGWQRPSASVEFIGLRHFGMQHQAEVDMAFMLHSAPTMLGPMRLRYGGGIGPSLALGRPSAEDGPDAMPDRRSRLQNYIALEIEASTASDAHTMLVLRIHHRSGVYGLVAPQGVGSNFVTLGLRHAF